MGKIRRMAALFLSCILIAGCGGQEGSDESTWRGIQAGMDDLSAITERIEYYDIVVESEPIFQWEQEKEGSPLSIKRAVLIGMQFYQGEPVQLWIEPSFGLTGELLCWDICIYRLDGSREVLQQVTGSINRCHGYLDQEGSLYWWANSSITEHSDGGTEKVNTFLKKYDPSGELLYEKQFEYGYNFEEIRQTADGRVYLIVSGNGMGGTESRRLAELDPATGLVTELDAVRLSQEVGRPHLGIWGGKLATFKFQSLLGNEITAIDVDDGSEACLLSFKGTSYVVPGLHLQDFRVLEDGSVELLRIAADGSEGLRERLRMAKAERTPIVLRGVNIGGWFAAQINSFNQYSETYHVVVEDCGEGNDVDDFARLTSVQIVSGRGPDILYGSLMKDYISGMLEKGLLEDLRPYMERSGIREEGYLPFTFAAWRDGDRIYGVSPASPGLAGYCMDSAVLGGREEADIETLVEVLLSRQEDSVFLRGYDSQKLLEFLLKGTDTLWGMVDWEKGSCDFSGELFARILESAKRYGDSKDRGEVGCIAESRTLFDIYLYDDRAERERNGKTICGVLFDDGCHAAVTSYSVLGINANSSHKEGAWEFISFLLGDEAQSASSGAPASRKAFGEWVEAQKEEFADGREIHMTYAERLPDGSTVITGEAVYTETDVTEEIIEEYTEMLEDARPCPVRTLPILDIIREEAADYFNGTKSAEEVARLVANRVQIYLDEGR